MNEQDKDIVSDIKHYIWDIEEKLDTLLNHLESEMGRICKEDEEEGEACFDLLIKEGFTIGTKFLFMPDNTEWTITGIHPKGFVVTGTINGEQKKLRIPADRKDRIEKALREKKLVILGQAEVKE